MFLANIDESLTGATTLLHEFGAPSGLQVNWAKTCLFHVRQWMENPNQVGSIRWEPHCLIYLGTHIYHMQEDLLEGNVGRALRGIKEHTILEYAATLSGGSTGTFEDGGIASVVVLLQDATDLDIKLIIQKAPFLSGGVYMVEWQATSGFDHDDATQSRGRMGGPRL